MKVLVVGATGGSGRAAVEQLLAAGHEVTAFARRELDGATGTGRLRIAIGDATSEEDVARAVRGQQAVVVTLGIAENPVRVRLLGPARTPLDVRSRGTRNVIAAMRREGVRRLVVQTSYGVGPTRDRLGAADRVFFALLLKPQIADTEAQEREVRASGLDWVIVQPVHLTDGEDGTPVVSTEGRTGRMTVSRRGVGRVLAEAVQGAGVVHRTLSVSGALSAPGAP